MAVHAQVRLVVGVLIGAGALVGMTGATAAARTVPAPVAVAGTVPAAVARAQPLGPAAGSQHLSLQVDLPLHDFAGLEAAASRLSTPGSPGYQRFLTPAQLTARYGPTVAQLGAVESYLRSAGIKVVSATPQRNVIDASTTVSVADRAFGVRIWRWRGVGGGNFYASRTNPVVPASVAPLVLAISGLDDLGQLEPETATCVVQPTGGPPSGTCAEPGGVNNHGYTPAQLQEAYGVTKLAASGLCGVHAECDGAGQSVGILEFGGSWDQPDESQFDSQYGLNSPPATAVCPQGVVPCPLPEKNLEITQESDLDVEAVHAIAPAAQVIVYETPKDLGSGLGDLLSTILNASTITTTNSISYGMCESKFGSSAAYAAHQQFAMLALRGETFFVSSGDHGKYCDNYSTAITGPTYPASDPLVTAVGGTNLLLNTDNSYAAEYAWSESGGGSSTYSWNKRPSWQRGTGIPAGGQRLVPDVSAEAFCSLPGCRGQQGYDYDITGPGTSYPNAALGFSVRTRCPPDAQCWISDGGTSLASPIWASIAAIYNQYAASAGQAPLNANVNAQLYHMAFTDRHPGGPITDVTSQAESGADLYQNSGRGWDGATGVGSPQLYAMATASGGQLSFPNQYQMLGTPGSTTPDLDCAAANFCLAIGTGAEVHYYNGSTWSENQYALSYANSVSCASTAFCAAAAYNGVYVSTVSGSWNHFYTSATFSPRNISCPAAGQCVITGVNAAQKTVYAVLSGGKMGTPKTITGDPVPIGIACSSAQFCLGLGQASGENVSDTFNGSTWTAPQKLGPAGYNAGPTCVPNGSCYAAGGSNTYQFNSAGRTSLGSLAGQNFTAIACPANLACTGATASGHVASYNGTAWTLGKLVAPGSFLATLSCPATTFCVGQSYQGYSSYFNGTTWSAMSRTDPDGFVMSVSCPTATFCGAFDGVGEVSFFLGSHWSAPVMLDPVINGYQDGSISCVSATFCALVDSNGRAFTYNGSQWSSGTSLSPGGTFINSVSCASPAMCVAIDIYGDVYGFNGKTWRFTHVTGLPGAGYLPAVSCPTTKFCMAVGGDQAEEFTGGSWQAAKQVAPSSATLHAVSCVSASYCLAGDRETGDLFTYHNGKWGSIKQGGVLTDATSCFGTESCVVSGGNGADYVDGTTVSGLNVPGEPNVEDLGASCPSAELCFVTSGGEISW